MSKQGIERFNNGQDRSHSPFFQKRKIPYENYLRSLFLFCLIFSLIIFADYFLPFNSEVEKINEWYIILDDQKLDEYNPLIEQLEGSNLYYKIKTENSEIALHREDAVALKEGDSVIIRRTKIFNTIVEIKKTDHSFTCKPYINTYGFFLLMPISLFLLSVAGLSIRMRDDWLYSVAVIEILLLGGFVVLRLLYL